MGLKKQFLKSKPVCKVTFSLPKEAANGAKEVKVLGEFNNWEWNAGVPMKAKNGEFTAVVELATGKNYQFRYQMDNKNWENDWNADNYIPTPFGVDNSVVVVPETVASMADVKAATTKKKTTKKLTAKKTSPKKTTKKTTTTTADKLTKIEGIGPKIEQLLKNDGIYTFANLAKSSNKRLQSILTAAGNRFKMHDPTTWPQQAKLAADAKWDELKKLQAQLKGGRK